MPRSLVLALMLTFFASSSAIAASQTQAKNISADEEYPLDERSVDQLCMDLSSRNRSSFRGFIREHARLKGVETSVILNEVYPQYACKSGNNARGHYIKGLDPVTAAMNGNKEAFEVMVELGLDIVLVIRDHELNQ